jgi:uncharacterized protein
VRKRLCGVGPLDRLGPEGYTRAVSERAYAAAFDQAARIAGAGHTAIVDAVFARPSDRLEVERLAGEAGVPFTGLWLEAPLGTLLRRVSARHADPSDADAAVVRQQAADGVGDVAWHRVNADASLDAILVESRKVLERASGLSQGTSTAAPESRPARRSSSA